MVTRLTVVITLQCMLLSFETNIICQLYLNKNKTSFKFKEKYKSESDGKDVILPFLSSKPFKPLQGKLYILQKKDDLMKLDVQSGTVLGELYQYFWAIQK